MAVFEEEDDSIDLMDGEEEWGTIAGQQQAAEGMYSDDVVEDNASAPQAEPSLADIAGETPAE